MIFEALVSLITSSYCGPTRIPERYKLKTEKNHLTKVTVYLIHSSPEAIRNAVTSDLLVNW